MAQASAPQNLSWTVSERGQKHWPYYARNIDAALGSEQVLPAGAVCRSTLPFLAHRTLDETVSPPPHRKALSMEIVALSLVALMLAGPWNLRSDIFLDRKRGTHEIGIASHLARKEQHHEMVLRQRIRE